MDLIDAIKAEHLAEVQRLLAEGADPNQRRDKRSAMDFVPRRADAITCALIEAGAWQSDLVSRMVWAVTTGRPATVQKLIDGGADLNKVAPKGSPLEVAARYGHFEIAETLLRAGADPCHGDPVSNAISNGHPDIALLLLGHGAEAKGLETAAWLGQNEVVQQLLQHQPEVDQVHKDHRTIPLHDFTALHAAALAGHQAIVDLLVKSGANRNLRDGQGRRAGELGNLRNLEADRDLDHELRLAIENYQIETVQSVLDLGANPNQRDQRRATPGYTPLMLAAAGGNLEILDLLLQRGADPEKNDSEAPREGLQRIAKLAGKEAIKGEPFGHTPLFAAARHGQAKSAARLLQAGANPNRQDFLDETPLHWAAEAGHLEVLQVLLNSGAKTDAKALMAALDNNHPECGLALLESGVVPDQKTFLQAAYLADASLLGKMLALKPKLKLGKALGATAYATRTVPADQAPPGHWTTIFNENGCFKRIPEPEEKILEAIDVLLAAGAPVNDPGDTGPILYGAASQGLTGVVLYLLEAGADPTLTYSNSTPFQIAELMGHEDTARVLESVSGPAAGPPPPEAPKARKTPKGLKQPQFKTMPDVSELEAICGSQSTRPDYLRGGCEIHLRNDIDLLALQRQWLPKGLYLFHPGSPSSLAALPADHWRVALAVMQTNGINSDLGPGDIVKWLETLEKTQPFELNNIGHDRLEGVFQTAIAEPRKLARKMYRFCSDIVDQGCETVEALAELLQEQPARLFFWWD